MIKHDSNVRSEIFDLVIIGGSFSGLSCALKSSEAGLKVAVLDRKLELDCPIRTSGGSWIKDLRNLGIPDYLWNPIYRIRVFSPNKSVYFDYTEPEACVLNVKSLINFLATKALANETTLILGATATRVDFDETNYVHVAYTRFGKESIVHSKLVVDASGHNSFFSKSSGINKVFERLGFGAEYEGECLGFPQQESWLLLGSEFSPRGYAYIFPIGENKVRIGVDLIDPKNGMREVNQFLDKFMSEDKRVALYTEKFKPLSYHFGIVPSDKMLDKTIYDRLLVVGDAAGQVNYITGEGIRFAIELGYLAGEVASKAIKSNTVTEEFLVNNYDLIWRQKYASYFKLGAIINRTLSELSDKTIDNGVGTYLNRLSAQDFTKLLKLEISPKDTRAILILKLLNLMHHK